MSVINAIRTVCQRITRRLKVYEYTTSSGDVVLTVKTQRYHDGVLWEGAWVELFGANEKRRYQVIKLTPFDKQPDLIEVTLNITDLDSGVKQLALLLDYQFGHKEEIQQTLVEQSRDVDWKSKLWPKLILFLDITESRAAIINAPINIAICTNTNKAFKALDREVESFEKVLHPLYELFLKELELAPGITINYPVQHDYTDRYFWGSDPTPDKNVFAALLDAIEINNLNIIIDKNIC